MNHVSLVTSKEVADQFSIAIQLLLEWIKQRKNSKEHKPKNAEDNPLEPDFLTAPEVAKILKISKSNVYKLIQQGEIPSVRIRRSVRVREKDLEEFAASNRV